MKTQYLYQRRSAALKIAHRLKKAGFTFMEAQKRAWKVVKAVQEMKKDEIMIRFLNAEGQIQQRPATLKGFPIDFKNTSRAKSNPVQIKYYDLYRDGWRSFNAGRFVSFAA